MSSLTTKKSRIQGTLNLSTNADSSTNTKKNLFYWRSVASLIKLCFVTFFFNLNYIFFMGETFHSGGGEGGGGPVGRSDAWKNIIWGA